MTSETIRDPNVDHLLTPSNCALVIIDYQPTQIGTIGSANSRDIVRNIVRVARVAREYEVPTVVSTVNVKNGVNGPTIPEILEVLPGVAELDRTTINAWEDIDVRAAVELTNRKKLVICALWTEVCLVFPGLDALRDGYEVYPVVDAVAGTSTVAHNAGLRRLEQAGAKAVSVVQFACELQRDWARQASVPFFGEVLSSIEGDSAELASVN
jgi:nicotinamidase-related amidase